MAVFAGLALAFGLMAMPLRSRAQVSSYGDKTEGKNLNNELPTVLRDVQVTQHLNAQLPLSAAFVDDHGQPVTLGKYFDGKHPVILTTVYYNCPMLC
ncbi:MAG: SCO family protein, partial [Acidobacteriaceae bacterium]